MNIKPEMVADYATWKENNSKDFYSKGVVDYLERWAALMEAKLAEGETIQAVAEATSREADTEGISGFMYGMAVSALAHCWQHGEALRKWHNKEYDYEGDGTVNPAILTINLGLNLFPASSLVAAALGGTPVGAAESVSKPAGELPLPFSTSSTRMYRPAFIPKLRISYAKTWAAVTRAVRQPALVRPAPTPAHLVDALAPQKTIKRPQLKGNLVHTLKEIVAIFLADWQRAPGPLTWPSRPRGPRWPSAARTATPRRPTGTSWP